MMQVVPQSGHSGPVQCRAVRPSNPVIWLTTLVLGACALVISTYHYFHHTWDEPEHLAAGMQLIDRGVYSYDQQHPPLARVAMAIGPYLAGAHSYGEPGPSGEQEGRDLLYRTGNYDLLLTLARLGVLPFYAVMLLATWAWARYVYGRGVALLATALLAATPVITGHAGVAALDIPGAAMCTLAFYCLLRWLNHHHWRYALAGGISAGLAVGTKLSGLPFVALVASSWALTAMATHTLGWTRHRPSMMVGTRWLVQGACVAVLALLAAIFCYGFQFHYAVTDAAPYNTALSYVFGRGGWAHDVSHTFARHVPLPVGLERLIWSIESLVMHNTTGHLSYLLGSFSQNGFRYFYPVALAVKTPLPLLLAGVAGIVFLCARLRTKGWVYASPALVFMTLLAFCCIYSHINIGVRHVFVLYPAMAIAAAALLGFLWKRYAHSWARGAVVTLLGAQAVTMVISYPDYLAYFNVTAGAHPERILIDSDLDWSQDIKRLQQRLVQLQVTKFGFVYRGSADVVGEHLPGVWLVQPFSPATGWIAASIYARDTVSQGKAFEWLKQYTPRERVGKSIDLYYIPEKALP
jgi:4-amino-4-deoxy-L-arabinose transferase-like glycosyltransferase